MLAWKLLLVTLLGLGASTAAASPVPQPRTVTDLAGMISATGLGCHDLQLAAPPLATSEGSCTIWHEAGVALDVLATHTALVRQLPKAVAAICTVQRKDRSAPKIVFVVGVNWIASFESRTNARPLAKAMHAKAQPVKCS